MKRIDNKAWCLGAALVAAGTVAALGSAPDGQLPLMSAEDSATHTVSPVGAAPLAVSQFGVSPHSAQHARGDGELSHPNGIAHGGELVAGEGCPHSAGENLFADYGDDESAVVHTTPLANEGDRSSPAGHASSPHAGDPHSSAHSGEGCGCPQGAPSVATNPDETWRAAGPDHPPVAASVAPPTPGEVERATGANAYDIAGLHAERTSLAGKIVRVRGRVVKVIAGVMQTNFVHLQDGTGSDAQATRDLTLTMDLPPEVGATLLVEGVAVIDHDVGTGSAYPVLIERARPVEEAPIVN